MFSFLKWLRSQIAAAVAAGIEDGVQAGVARVTGGQCVLDIETHEPVKVPLAVPANGSVKRTPVRAR
jgi:hypothetical protein